MSALPAGSIDSSQTEKATAFYGGLFGWTAEQPDPRFGGYFTFSKDGKHVAGCMGNDGSTSMPDAWTIYLETDDIDKVAERTVASGGLVEYPPIQVAENGSMAIVRDPGGARGGVWQPDQVKGFEVIDEAGAPAWFELHTRTYRESVDFYRSVFGWSTKVMSDNEDFRYTTLVDAEGQRAGIMDVTADQRRASLPPGRSTSTSRMPIAHSSWSRCSAARSCSPLLTPRTAASPRSPTPPARRSG